MSLKDLLCNSCQVLDGAAILPFSYATLVVKSLKEAIAVLVDSNDKATWYCRCCLVLCTTIKKYLDKVFNRRVLFLLISLLLFSSLPQC